MFIILILPLVNSITLFLSLSNAVTLKNFDKLTARYKLTYLLLLYQFLFKIFSQAKSLGFSHLLFLDHSCIEILDPIS